MHLQVYGNVCSHSHVLVENFVRMCEDDEYASIRILPLLFRAANTNTHGHPLTVWISNALRWFEEISSASAIRVNREIWHLVTHIGDDSSTQYANLWGFSFGSCLSMLHFGGIGSNYFFSAVTDAFRKQNRRFSNISISEWQSNV